MFLTISLSITSCSTSPKYIVQKRSEIRQGALDSFSVNYLPINDADLQNSKILDSVYSLLIIGKYNMAYDYIVAADSLTMITSGWKMAKVLYWTTIGDYERATMKLKRIDDSAYPVLKRLLLIDLAYEQQLSFGRQKYKEFLADYQALIDAYPDDELLKKIIFIRSRYLRYNY